MNVNLTRFGLPRQNHVLEDGCRMVLLLLFKRCSQPCYNDRVLGWRRLGKATAITDMGLPPEDDGPVFRSICFPIGGTIGEAWRRFG